MKIALIIVVIIVVILVVVYFVLKQKGPDVKVYEYMLIPQVSEKADQNMLVVEVTGDPALTGIKAVKLLYSTYFKLKGVSKSMKGLAPRARWPFDFNTPKDHWKGQWALPIPDDINTLPKFKNPDNLNVYITKWEYGTVAEILHIGSYATETPSIKKLTEYITQQGYTIVGEHEEEYLKGPGMFGKGNPNKYLTIIRYRISKTNEEVNSSTP